MYYKNKYKFISIKGGEKMTKVLYQVRLDEDIVQGIETIAKQKNRKKSEIVRKILENYVENYNLYNK